MVPFICKVIIVAAGFMVVLGHSNTLLNINFEDSVISLLFVILCAMVINSNSERQ